MFIGILPTCKSVRTSEVLKLAVEPGCYGRAVSVLTAQEQFLLGDLSSEKLTLMFKYRQMPTSTQFVYITPWKPLCFVNAFFCLIPHLSIHNWSHRACNTQEIFLLTLLSNTIKYSDLTILLRL